MLVSTKFRIQFLLKFSPQCLSTNVFETTSIHTEPHSNTQHPVTFPTKHLPKSNTTTHYLASSKRTCLRHLNHLQATFSSAGDCAGTPWPATAPDSVVWISSLAIRGNMDTAGLHTKNGYKWIEKLRNRSSIGKHLQHGQPNWNPLQITSLLPSILHPNAKELVQPVDLLQTQ